MTNPSDNILNYRVYFGGNSSFRMAQNKSIFIVPTEGSWNDFGYKTNCKLLIRDSKSEVTEIPVMIGFMESEESDRSVVHQLLSEQNSGHIEATENIHYFCMLPDMEEYRTLLQRFGNDEALKILFAIHDLVACLEFKAGPSWLTLAPTTEVFGYSFVRSSDAYFAFKNANSVLRGVELEKIGVMSRSLCLRYTLDGAKNEHELVFSFDHNALLPKRIAVVIGENGVGKSQALKFSARSILNGSGELFDIETGERPIVGRLLAFAPTSESESVFPAANNKGYRISYRRFSLNRSRRSIQGNSIPDSIVQLARSTRSIGSNSRWKIFCEALKAIRDPESLVLTTTDPNEPFVFIIKELSKGGEKQLLKRYTSINLKKDPVRFINGNAYPLSSGEISFIKFAAQVSLHIENGTLLLMDEPETHLHPHFISRFVELLDRLLKLTGSSAIIATHSVYFVREVFREQVTILERDDDGYINNFRPRLRTFGGDVGLISSFVFGEDEPSLLAKRVLKDFSTKNTKWEALYENLKDELSTSLLMALRREVEDTLE